MISFTELVTAVQNMRNLLAKGRGHKYIKRIPVGQTPSGGIKYRYIYNATSTVGGKNLLDEAHLKAGTKLMLHSEDGAEVHAHITEVKGDKVTFVYDDGDKKGQERTVTKQKLLGDFNQEHDVKGQLSAAKEKLLADIKSAVAGGTISAKQLARLVDRLKSLDPASTTSETDKQIIGDHYDNAPERPPRLSDDEINAMSEEQLEQEMRERNRYRDAMVSLIRRDPLNEADQRKLNAIEEERRNAPDDEDWRVTDERDARRDAMFEKIQARRARLFSAFVFPVTDEISRMDIASVAKNKKRRQKEARKRRAEQKKRQQALREQGIIK